MIRIEDVIKNKDVEKDMQISNTYSDWIEQIFARYPLIGSRILKPEEVSELTEYCKKIIDKYLNNPYAEPIFKEKMIITIAVINNAKNYDLQNISDSDSGFWNYIALQFGYRNAGSIVAEIIKPALKDSLKRKNKLFIEAKGRNEYRTTVLIHALSTKKSWFALLDFLFDFYKNNLDWEIIPNDDRIETMIQILNKKLSGNKESDEELMISSTVYSFQIGVRRLIAMRPKFMRKLFETMIRRIDSMIKSEYKPVTAYEEYLCEEWFRGKLTGIQEKKKIYSRTGSQHRDIALKNNEIRAKYIFRNNKLNISLPDIRLENENAEKISLYIYYNDTIVYSQNMKWYGNELGKTLIGDTIPLPDYFKNEESINIRIQIVCDNEFIYDSEKTLFRKFLIFFNEREISSDKINKDNGYVFVTVENTELSVENADVNEICDFAERGFKAYFINEIHDGYFIRAGEKIVSFDDKGTKDIRIIPPEKSEYLPRLIIDGNEYHFAYINSLCSITLKKELKNRYRLLKDNKEIEWSSVQNSDNNVYEYPVSADCRIRIIDIDNEQAVFDRYFIAVSEAKFEFARDFYYSDKDYEDALLHVKIDDFSFDSTFAQNDNEVIIPYRNGEIHVPVPKITIQENTGWLDSEQSAWYIKNIDVESRMTVSAPENINIGFKIGSRNIPYDGKEILIGSELHKTEGSQKEEFSMTINEQTYRLADIYYSERFVKVPEFHMSGRKLYWDKGGRFIGNADRKFTLSLFRDNEDIREFPLDENTDYIDIPEDMHDGIYMFEISMISGNIFKRTKEMIAKGSCIVGDINVFRFENKRIAIESFTEIKDDKDIRIYVSEHKPYFIDSIEFIGMEETSEGYCPVYKGTVYSYMKSGERYELSFKSYKTQKGASKTAVNPVRIVYINDTELCITDCEGDGIYFYHYQDNYYCEEVYALTDREPEKFNKNIYSIADLYSYRMEEIKNV